MTIASREDIIAMLLNSDYPTQDAKAEALGYANRSGLSYRLREDPTITEDLAVMVLQTAKAELSPIIRRLADSAKNGNMNAINTFLKYAGQLIDVRGFDPEKPLTIKHELSEGISEDEMVNIAKSVIAEAEKE